MSEQHVDQERKGWILSPKGLQDLEDGLIDDPYMELMLEIMKQAGTPLFRDNVLDVAAWFVDQYGDPKTAVEALRNGDAGLEKDYIT